MTVPGTYSDEPIDGIMTSLTASLQDTALLAKYPRPRQASTQGIQRTGPHAGFDSAPSRPIFRGLIYTAAQHSGTSRP